MTWQEYPTILFLTVPIWLIGIVLLYVLKGKKEYLAHIFIIGGIFVLLFFTLQLWMKLDRPPFRTLAETRLWYSVFLSMIGSILYFRWKFKWLLVYNIGMAILFLIINYFRPDTFDQTLMPALQSPWFIPHVIVYILAYALLTAATLIATDGILAVWRGNQIKNRLVYADNLVYMGFAFLTFGLLFGALWAKEAWGHYWTWDPKETWALITWLVYLLYMHFRHLHKNTKQIIPLWILIIAMIVILITWFGVNYLAVAENSVHTFYN